MIRCVGGLSKRIFWAGLQRASLHNAIIVRCKENNDLFFTVNPALRRETLKFEPMSSSRETFPLELTRFVFRNAGGNGEIYAVIDAAKTLFLENILDTSGLPYRSLYLEEGMNEVAPHLVQLDRDRRLTSRLFAFDPTEPDPRDLLDKEASIIISSPLGLDELWGKLRRYTMLPEETGVRRYFRFSETGMLDVALSAAGTAAVEFFQDIEAIYWNEPSLDPPLWNLHRLALNDGWQDRIGERFMLDAGVRQAMRHAMHRQKARKRAIKELIPVAARRHLAATLTRLMDAGFDEEFSTMSTWRLLSQLPAGEHETVWAKIESGKYSLAFINMTMAEKYNLEFERP